MSTKQNNIATRFTGGYEPEILSINTYELFEVIKACITNPEFAHSLFMWGPTGTGKSSVPRQVLKDIAESTKTTNWKPAKGVEPSGLLEVYGEWGMIDLRLANKDSIAIQGLMNLAKDNARWIPPDDMPVVGQEARFPKKGILLLDELPLATPPIQSIAYGIVLDKKAGNFKILPGWKIMAAGNLAREKTHGFEMAHPLKNRFLHYFVRVELDSFKRWSYQNGMDNRVLGFLNWSPDYLHQDCSKNAYGFPTPRSWEMVSDVLKLKMPEHLRTINISAAIGQSTAAVFNGFLNVYEEETTGEFADLDKILNGEIKPKPLTTQEPQRAYAVATRLVGHIRSKPTDCGRAFGFLLGNTWAQNREIARACVRDMSDALRDKNGQIHPEILKATTEHHAAITEKFSGMI